MSPCPQPLNTQSAEPLPLSTVIRDQLVSLCKWAHLAQPLRAQAESVLRELTRGALDRPAASPFDGLSYINASGLPFQWSLSLGPGKRSIRFLCEAGTPGTSPSRRLALSLQCLADACKVLRIPKPTWLTEVIVPNVLPRELPSYWRSAIWLGCCLRADGYGLKTYFNLNRGTPLDRWRCMGRLLAALGWTTALERLCAMSGQVSKGSKPTGVAADIEADGTLARLKIYFHSSSPSAEWLYRWHCALELEHLGSSVRAFLDAFPCSNDSYPASGLIVTLKLEKSGDASLATDVAATKWIRTDKEIVDRAQRIAIGLTGASGREIPGFLKAIDAWPPSAIEPGVHRFVGLGVTADGTCRLNLYVEPPMPSARGRMANSREGNRRDSVRAGIKYLMARRQEGCWRDFELPVGRSDTWVTAYVLVCLTSIKASWLSSVERKAIRQSGRWLSRHRSGGGGWGYNTEVENDADSTAMAILALRGTGAGAPREAVRFLLACRATNGGFRTFRPGGQAIGGWLVPGVEVSWAALDALNWSRHVHNHRPTTHFLAGSQTKSGFWPAYWWTTPLYSTAGVLKVAGVTLREEVRDRVRTALRSFAPIDAFEAALALMCAQRLELTGKKRALAATLRTLQASDGSWPSSAWLRLADPRLEFPSGSISSGKLFHDGDRIFTTATAVQALAMDS